MMQWSHKFWRCSVHQSGIGILTFKRRIKLDTCRCRTVHWITHCVLSGSSPNHFPRNGSVWGQKIATDTMQAGVAGNLWWEIYWTKKWYAAVQAVSETNSQRIVWTTWWIVDCLCATRRGFVAVYIEKVRSAECTWMTEIDLLLKLLFFQNNLRRLRFRQHGIFNAILTIQRILRLIAIHLPLICGFRAFRCSNRF